MTAAIVADRLTKRFGSVRALTDLDLEVECGEVFGFLGPNGAGKTTTIRLLLDVLRPSSGRVQVLDGSGADPGVRARIGYLPADLHLDPSATVDELLAFAAAVRGHGHEGARQRELLDRFDLDPSRTVRELSTGNRRKVGIVLAMAHRPELLILDEPTSGLDPLLQHEFHLAIQQATAEGVTVFLSSHVLPEVELLAHRVGILREGRLVTVATVDALRSRARQRLILLAPDARPEDFDGVTGVVASSGDIGTVHLEVDGSLDAVVKAAGRFEVQRIIVRDDDLESTFLDLYRGDET